MRRVHLCIIFVVALTLFNSPCLLADDPKIEMHILDDGIEDADGLLG